MTAVIKSIDPILQYETSQPLITFFVFAYNQEAYVEEACSAALRQDYSPLEIIFSDDCSTDRTYEIMKAVAAAYHGPHTIRLNRNPQNLGLIDHVNLSFRISNGELIVAAAGDDISFPHRVSRIVEAYIASEKSALLIHSNVSKIDINEHDCGVWIPPVISRNMSLTDIAEGLELYIGASGAWNKKLFEHFGPLHYKKTYEDLVLCFRAALLNSLLYINESLVNYRVGVGMTKKTSEQLEIFYRLTNSYWSYVFELQVYQQRLMDLRRVMSPAIEVRNLEILLRKRCLLIWPRKVLRLLSHLLELAVANANRTR